MNFFFGVFQNNKTQLLPTTNKFIHTYLYTLMISLAQAWVTETRGYMDVPYQEFPTLNPLLIDHLYSTQNTSAVYLANPAPATKGITAAPFADLTYLREQQKSYERDIDRKLSNVNHLISEQKFPAVLQLLQRTLLSANRELGLDHPTTINIQQYLFVVHLRQEKFAEAEAIIKSIIEKCETSWIGHESKSMYKVLIYVLKMQNKVAEANLWESTMNTKNEKVERPVKSVPIKSKKLEKSQRHSFCDLLVFYNQSRQQILLQTQPKQMPPMEKGAALHADVSVGKTYRKTATLEICK